MIHNRRVAALVPIKDHSERVKGKNFRDFCGKPLYHHVIYALDRVYAVDQIIINTDSLRVIGEAPAISRKVSVLARPDELRGDFVSTNKLFAYDLNQSNADIYLQTHATNPLLKTETIAAALTKFVAIEGQYDSLFGVNEYHSRFYSAKGEAINHNPDDLVRTQDLPALYEENSSIYVFTKESFAKHDRRIGERPFMFVTPHVESTDIDDEFTFRLAEMLAMYAEKV